MKVQVSKYWPLDLHVTRGISVTIFLLISLNSVSQNVVESKEYYRLIEEIALESKNMDSLEFEKLHNWVKVGKFTKEDSIKYVEKKTNYTPEIFSTTDNSALKLVLEESLLSDFKSLNQYFTSNKIKNIIDNIPEEKKLKKKFSNDILLLEPDSSKNYGHFFSSLVLIEDNQYILYHYYHNNNIFGTVELIIVTKLEIGYKIKYRVHFNRWNF
ncbi:hypothetical protein [Maribacter sp. IgM3_T14_3]|uniref:hypothetical protein n=1 Tax=Maribacter sp. IgM3_T14_3 TaxID=3415140 RepID=UPI003C6FCF48